MAGGLASVALLARLWSLQDPPEKSAPPEPVAAAPARSASVTTNQPTVEDVREGSVAIIQALVARDLEALARLTPTPFSFDGVEVTTRAAVRQHWAALLEKTPVDQLQLRGVEVLSYEDLVARSGKPPVRLQRLPLQGSQVAVVDLNGKGAVLLWRRRAKGFQLFAISD